MRNKSNILKRVLMFLLTLILSAEMGVCTFAGNRLSTKTEKSNLTVNFIDVGQGSATLMESDGHYALMDGGGRDASSKVVAYLKKQGVKKLDYIIVSHYDEDHIGGVVGALNVFPVTTVIAPDYKADSKIYKSFCQKLENQKLSVTNPVVGMKCTLGDAAFTIIAPNSKKYEDENAYSVGIKLENGKNSFIICGDATIDSEYEMIDNKKINLDADVYVANHHGSTTANSEAFIEAISPSSVVISCGKDNSYGHPHENVMKRFEKADVDLYRTDRNGDIVAVSDGTNIKFQCKPTTDYSPGNSTKEAAKKSSSKKQTAAASTAAAAATATAAAETPAVVQPEPSPAPATQAAYIGNLSSKKFHYAGCSAVKKMNESNKYYYNGTRDEMIAMGYEPCKICNP